MEIIEYDENGWICNRYPYNITEVAGSIEVDNEVLGKTLSAPIYHAWRVVDGEIVLERYEETPHSEIIEERIWELKRLLADSDYKATKYAEGWLTEEEYAPIKAQRQAWRDEINELEQENASSDELPNEDIEEEEGK